MNKNDVEKIAALAHIDLHDNFGESIVDDLTQIVSMVNQIKALNTSNVEPMAHPLSKLTQRIRKDEAYNFDEHILDIAPKTEANLFLVPKVL